MLSLIPFPNIDPVIFSFDIMEKTFAIHWYAVAYIIGFLLAWRWIVFLISNNNLWKNNTAPMSASNVEDLLSWMIIGTILGGRLGYVLFYQLSDSLADPISILRIWDGGMSFHGGFVGVIIAGILFCKKNNLANWSVGDAIASSAPFGLFLGRIANFINAELWGRPTDLPWGVIFPSQIAQNCGQALGEICARHPSQLYEAILEGIILFLVMAYFILRKSAFKSPGLIIGLFFIGYGIARIIVEGFRQSDAQFITQENPLGHIIRFGSEIDSFGLSMGQILSLPMIVIGGFIIYIANKRV